MKTRFLTQDSARIDPIPCWIKGFSFMNSKTIVGVQELISPYSLNEILLSNTLWTQESIESKRFKDFRV